MKIAHMAITADLGAVIYRGWRHRESLVRAMFTDYRRPQHCAATGFAAPTENRRSDAARRPFSARAPSALYPRRSWRPIGVPLRARP